MPNNTTATAPAAEHPNSSTIQYHASPIPNDSFSESVYNLLPVAVSIPAKQSMYKSIHAAQVKGEVKNGKKEAASMGRVKVGASAPQEFLRKGEGIIRIKPATTSTKPKKAHIKPSLPTDRGVLPVQTQKEYIKINALENIHSVPKKVAQKDPLYISKPSYGKVPAYLAKRISSQQQESVECAANITNQQSNAAWRGQIEAGIVPLPEDERLKVLDGLKANWTRLNSDYQKLSLTVDTVPKIARKVNMEQQLKQLEEQMAKFSHANILVDFNSA